MPYTPSAEPYRWLSVPRWYLWEGGFLLTAAAQGVVPAHAHHAIQVVIALDGCVAISGADGTWHERRGLVVRPDAEHSFDCNGALGVMLFVDPETSEGAWLAASLREAITTVSDARLDAIVPGLRAFATQPDDIDDVAARIRGCVQGLRPGLAPARRVDARVTTVIEAIRASDGRGPRRRFRRRGPPHPHLLSDGGHGALGPDARRVHRDAVAFQRPAGSGRRAAARRSGRIADSFNDNSRPVQSATRERVRDCVPWLTSRQHGTRSES